MKSPTVIFYPAPALPLTRDEIQHVFAQFAPGDPIMVALRQILAERLAAATGDNLEPRLNERLAGMVAGRMQEISSLQQEFETLHKGAAELRHSRAVQPVKTTIRK